ncbi:MAG TPA: DUF2127 domain-containing protein [Acidimicrobiales bacterium]|nr:DUF2127 domain-containing protein [Acidimicrobiales bacterium]
MAEPGTGGRILLWGKLAYSALEVVAGAVLVVFAIVHLDLAATLHRAALRELAEDPGDFTARHLLDLRSAGTLHPRREAEVGAGVLVYGAVKAALVVAVLRRSRRFVRIGAVAFVAIAAAGLVVLVRRPTPAGLALGALDIAVAAVVVREARRVG